MTNSTATGPGPDAAATAVSATADLVSRVVS